MKTSTKPIDALESCNVVTKTTIELILNSTNLAYNSSTTFIEPINRKGEGTLCIKKVGEKNLEQFWEELKFTVYFFYFFIFI